MTAPTRLVLVTWEDAQDSPQTWHDATEAAQWGQQSCVIESVGFVVSDGPRYLTLGGDWDAADEDFGTVRKIPKSTITGLVELSRPSPETDARRYTYD